MVIADAPRINAVEPARAPINKFAAVYAAPNFFFSPSFFIIVLLIITTKLLHVV